MTSKLLRIFGSALLALAVSSPIFAQEAAEGTSPTKYGVGMSPGSVASYGYAVGSVVVYLRTEDEQPLPKTAEPVVRIYSAAGGTALENVPSPAGDSWVFSGLGVGNSYEVQVTANGFLPARETVALSNTPGVSSSVIVFMQPLDQELAFHPPAGQFVLTPKAEKEVQHALHDLQYGHVASAEKHAAKAIQISPDNPYAQYVMGLTYLLTNRIESAKPYLEKSVSIDSREAPALTALGTVRYRLGDSAGAARVLSEAVQLDATSWKAEWFLAASYLSEEQYQQALDHGNRALALGKGKAGQARLVVAQALAGLGQRAAAAEAFEAFANQYPKDPNIAAVRNWIDLLKEPPKVVTVRTKMLVPAEPPVEVPPRPNWAPPDVDSVQPFAVSGGVCPLRQILEAAGKNAERLVSDLQEFTATEDFQEIEIKKGGNLEKPSEHSFKYLVLVDRVSPTAFDVREFRSHDRTQVQLPGRVEDTGVPALALAFHPIIQPDLDWKCEGLGTWKSQSAWIIHFEQKPKAPNVLAWFAGPSESYSLPLKGRAWVSEESKQVLHLDTDLVREIRPIDLKREHFSIEYRPVSFSEHDVELWLPVNVDSYIQYQGHFLHYYHHFNDFRLFWVGTSQKIGAPKEAEKEKQGKDQDRPQP